VKTALPRRQETSPDLQQVPPKIHQHGGQCPRVKKNIENHRRLEEPGKEGLGYDKMAGGGNGEKFREALQYSQQYGFNHSP